MILFLVISLSLIVFAAFAWAARGITFIDAHHVYCDGRVGMTDQERQVTAAAQWKGFDWPSKMHRISGSKGRMKDVGMIGLAIFQRLLNDRRTPYPLVLFSHVCTIASAVMTYAAAAAMWNEKVALLLFLLYLGCFWPHQISLTGAYHTLSQFLFLLAVVYLQKNFYFVSGLLMGLMMFSSASGRKFWPLYMGAFFWSLQGSLQPAWPDFFGTVGLLTLWGMGLFLLYFAYPPLVTAIYEGRAPGRLNRLLISRDKHPLDRYLALRGKIFSSSAKLTGALVFYTILCQTLSRSAFFYQAHLAVLSGILVVVLFLTAPNFLQNIRAYFTYWYSPKNNNHFLFYKDFFRKIGKPITDEMRGAGLSWILLFFARNTPFHSFLFLAASVFLFLTLDFWGALGLVLLGLSPILYGEMTRSPQFSRPYFPALLGILLVPGAAFFQAERILGEPHREWLWLGAGCFTAISAVWNGRVFLSDLLPSSLSPKKLENVLQKRGIKTIYTYDTPYNDHFVNAWLQNGKTSVEVRRIRSLSEVTEGYVAVPGTSCKALNIESYVEGIEGKDFDADPLLTELIRSKKISEAAVASFQTFGTSKIWALDSEVPSHRSLILKDITDEDRWRGRAWLLDAKKLSERNRHAL